MEYTPVYPEGVAKDAYEAALEKCVFGGGWLFNQSGMDVWFDFEGFVVKIPAGTKVRPDGWTLVRNQVSGMDTEEIHACPTPVTRSGFKFCNNRRYIYNILVVFSPDTAGSTTSYFGVPGRTLEEHIALINTMKLDKAMIIAEDLSFLPRCPSLKTIYIRYAWDWTGSWTSPLFTRFPIWNPSASCPRPRLPGSISTSPGCPGYGT